MSRLLDALRHLQQAEDVDPSTPTRRVTPRLSASIRKAMLGGDPNAPSARHNAAPPAVLFRVPQAQPTPPPAASISTLSATPEAAAPASPTPDPLRLIEVIQASISSAQQDHAPQPALASGSWPAAGAEQPQFKAPRPAPTAAEAELRSLLASTAHAQPYREMLSMVLRDLGGKTFPVIAIVGLDGQDSTEHVAAAVGTLIADQPDTSALLLEANPARSLSSRYATLPSTGLTELLAGRIELSAAICPTSHERLDLLPFGLATQEQASLLPPAFSAVLQQVRPSRSIVVDGGSLASPWAMSVGQAADVVYLVVRVGATSAEHATACVHRFRAAGGKLTGCIAVGPIAC